MLDRVRRALAIDDVDDYYEEYVIVAGLLADGDEPVAGAHFTALEEAFFAEGDALAERAPERPDDFSDLDDGSRPRASWASRLRLAPSPSRG